MVEQWFRSADTAARRDVLLDLAVQVMPGPWHPRLRDAVLAAVAAPEPPTDGSPPARAARLSRRPDPRRRAPRELVRSAAAAPARTHRSWHSALLHVADHLFTRRQLLEELR